MLLQSGSYNTRTGRHWLPVHKRVIFKTVVLVWKCLIGTAPGYLSELCVPVASASGYWHLRSASTGLLPVPRARTMIGQWSFAVAGRLCKTVFQLLYGDRRWHHTLSSDDLRPDCSTSDVLTNRRNIYHCSALLWHFLVILAPYTKLPTYLLT